MYKNQEYINHCVDRIKENIHDDEDIQKLKEKYKEAQEEYFSEDTAKRFFKQNKTAEDIKILEYREQRYAFYDELIRKLIIEGVVERRENGKFEDIEIVYR